jgi:hypothetical protein
MHGATVKKIIFINNFLASDFGGNASRLETSQASLPPSHEMLTCKVGVMVFKTTGKTDR